MKAIVQDRYGSADVLRLADVERPVPAADEVLVRIHAAAVDPGVWHLMTGLPYLVRVMGFGLLRPKVRVRGLDLAGRVEAVGRKVTRFARVKELIEAGKVAPVIGATYPLSDVPAAIRDIERGHARGKLVITVSAADAGRSASGGGRAASTR